MQPKITNKSVEGVERIKNQCSLFLLRPPRRIVRFSTLLNSSYSIEILCLPKDHLVNNRSVLRTRQALKFSTFHGDCVLSAAKSIPSDLLCLSTRDHERYQISIPEHPNQQYTNALAIDPGEARRNSRNHVHLLASMPLVTERGGDLPLCHFVSE